jgi:hypothetical protein
MFYPLITLFIVICAVLLVWGCAERGRIYEYPFLAAAVFLGWILPQLFGLVQDPYLPPGAFERVVYMTILCALMIVAGRHVAQRPLSALNWQYNDHRLTCVSAVLVLAGGYFFMQISRLPDELRSMTQASGPLVAYLFLAEMLSYGFAIAMLVFLRSRSLPSLLVIVCCSAFYLDRIVIAGRRAAMVDFVLTILLALWFQRRIALPLWLMLGGLVFAGVGVHSIGDYRRISTSADGVRWKQMSQIDAIGNLQDLIASGGSEMRNASYAMYATELTLGFDLGIWNWNMLIFNFVPAQIVGSDIKESLYIPLDDPLGQINYVPDTGSTMTGMTDAFRSFWYFGALKFFLIALVMGKLYRAAMSGHVVAQILYILLLGTALQTITHHTQRFLSAWVQMAILLLPILYVYRLPNPRARAAVALFGAARQPHE